MDRPGGLLMEAGPLSPEAIHVGGSHQPLPEVTPLDLSRQGHQSPYTHAQISWRLSPPTPLPQLHHPTRDEDTACLTFIQQNPPTYNLLPGPANFPFLMFEALVSHSISSIPSQTQPFNGILKHGSNFFYKRPETKYVLLCRPYSLERKDSTGMAARKQTQKFLTHS